VVGEVSPAAGVDLGAYCNRTVTLVGTMVAAPQGAPPHLVATRVLGADLRFNLPVTVQAALQEGQPPVRAVAFQEPSPEILPPGNQQAKGDTTPSAGRKSLLSPSALEGVPTPPPAPVSPSAPVSPPMLVSPLGPGAPPILVSPMTPGSPPMLVSPLAPGSPPMVVSPVTPGSPPVPGSPPGPLPGPFPVTVQPAESADACEPACGGCDFCCPRRGRLWGEVDYLAWWTQGMSVPPLVTQGGANDARPGALGQPNTTVLFGGDNILGGSRSGGRAEIGYWLDECHTSGFDGEYLGLEDANDDYRIWSSGNPVIARPIFNTNTGLPGAELVAFPGLIAGSVGVEAHTDFQTAALRWRWEWIGQGSFCEPGDCSLCQWGRRVDVTLGYRYVQLDDDLGIREELTTTNYVQTVPATPQGSFLIQDSFRTHNTFQGGELGLVFQTRQGRWTLEAAPKIALGNTRESVTINGSTTTTDANGNVTNPNMNPNGGLLALKSNIGDYQRDVFEVVPQTSLKLGYQLTPRLRATAGYDFLYWSRVARAGSQIDLAVNPNEVPGAPQTRAPGPPAPTFTFQDSGFWAQGLSFGLDYGW
jgi:hypothetical protein